MELLDLFEDKIQALLVQMQNLRHENEGLCAQLQDLQNKNNSLQGELSSCKNIIDEQKTQLLELQQTQNNHAEVTTRIEALLQKVQNALS